MSTDSFSAAEIDTIHKLFAWVEAEKFFDEDGHFGITRADEDGVTVTEFIAFDGMEKSEVLIPWLALSDPDAYAAQIAAKKAADEAERVARQQALREQAFLQQTANERALYEALKAKFEGADTAS
jgi:ABC-type branched-subunit amino acid transport system substrate-binding protein